MSDDLPERIRLNAEAVRIALSADSVARITRTVTPVLERLAAEMLAVPMDVEPSTFTVIQRREIAE
jgi:actin-like ATPase involved in cell morphogenesis